MEIGLRRIKRSVSVLLAAAILACGMTAAAAAQGSLLHEDVSDYPVIVLSGAWDNLSIYDEYDNWVEDVFAAGAAPVEALGSIMDELLERLTALDIQGVGDLLIGALWEIFEPIRMDENGDSVNPAVTNKGIWYWPGYDWAMYNYDWRQSPMDLADGLAACIDDVLGAYHTDKVNIQCISGSGAILMCYINEYGSGKLASAVFNVTMQNGSKLFGELAKRNFWFDADALGKTEKLVFFEEAINLREMAPWLEWLYIPGLLGILTRIIHVAGYGLLQRVYDEALVPLLFTMPGIWANVPMEDYAAAKKALFGSGTKYSGLAARMDDYRDKVMSRQDDIMLKLSREIKVAVRAGYGMRLMPLVKGSDTQGDLLLDTVHASFGAKCADPDFPFPFWYKQENKACGHDDHVSPDHLIDASTCLLPEQTWFTLHQTHNGWQPDLSGWYEWFLEAPDMNVHADPRFPQFMELRKDGGVSEYVPLETEAPGWLDLLISVGKWLLKAWRWLFKLPLIWVEWM